MNYKEHAYTLVENGYGPIPLTHAKGTCAEWIKTQFKPIQAKTVDWYCRKPWFNPDSRRMIPGSKCNRIGLVHGDCYGYTSVDIDIVDKKIAAEVDTMAREMLPDTPLVRVGLPPKQLMMFRTDGTMPSRRFLGMDIEIFASSGQIAAFGTHPKTGKPYDWIYGESPLTTKVTDLPPLSLEVLTAFLTAVHGDILPKHNKTGGGSGGFNGVLMDFYQGLAFERKVNDPIQMCIRQLERMKDGDRNPTLFSVIGYLDSQDATAKEIADFVDKWFPDDLRTDEYEDVHGVALAMAERTRKKFDDEGVAL